MSSSSSQNIYNLSISLGSMGDNNALITLYDNWGVDDAFMLNLAKTLEGLSWPTGTTFTLTKSARSEADFTADLTVTPPVFT